MRTRPSSAFTLIETITAMAVVIILTGLVLSISGYVTRKGSQARAQGEIAMLSTACESYKADTGAYPRDIEKNVEESKTDAISPKKHFNPASEEYEDSSRYLYRQLTGDKGGGDEDKPDGVPDAGETQYLRDFDPKILKTEKDDNGKVNQVKYFQDPWGFSYAYSTAGIWSEREYLKEVKDKGARAMRPSGEENPGFNTAQFDLWSTGGSKPATPPTEQKKKELEWAKWIKNW